MNEHMFVSSAPLWMEKARATILHADLDAFFASVEQRDRPELRGRPIAVGGGVVLAASYEARRHGVRSAMGGAEARRLCPGLHFVRPRPRAYSEASADVFRIFEETSPHVEGISIDEAFLEVGGLGRIAGTPEAIAERLRSRVRDQVGLPLSVGVASTKVLAKVASAQAKPDGLVLVPAGGELAFLHPLPVRALWGVGPKTDARLRGRGIRTVGQLAELRGTTVEALVGGAVGRHVHALANNRDPRAVAPRSRRRSMGAQRALGLRRRSEAELDVELTQLADRVARRLRAAGRVGRTVTLRLRFDDFAAVTRSATLPQATADTDRLVAALRCLLGSSAPLIRERGITLIGISISNLFDGAAVQLALPFDRSANGALDGVVDDLLERFGSGAIVRLSHLNRDPGIAMPALPDG